MDNQQVVTVVGSAGDEDDSVSLLFVLRKQVYYALLCIDTQHGEQAVSLYPFLISDIFSHLHLVTP